MRGNRIGYQAWPSFVDPAPPPLQRSRHPRPASSSRPSAARRVQVAVFHSARPREHACDKPAFAANGARADGSGRPGGFRQRRLRTQARTGRETGRARPESQRPMVAPRSGILSGRFPVLEQEHGRERGWWPRRSDHRAIGTLICRRKSEPLLTERLCLTPPLPATYSSPRRGTLPPADTAAPRCHR